MRKDFEKHSEPYVKNQKLKCSESGKIFYLNTQDACFARVKIDEGVVSKGTSQTRCDYLVIKQGVEDIEIFVELKGDDIKRAKEQLVATYKDYATTTNDVKHYPVIVTSPVRYKNNKSTKTRTTKDAVKAQLKKIFGNAVLMKEEVVEARYNLDKNCIEKTN